MTSDNRAGRRIIVTGGAGFIGSNFLKVIVPKYLDYEFICVDKLGYASHEHLIESIGVKIFRHDLSTQSDELIELFASSTDVIHFAAETSVDRLFIDPMTFTMSNLIGTQNVLECIRKHNPQCRLLHVSTDEVYGDCPELSKEFDTFNPTNPYSASKAAAEMMINAYKFSFGINAVIVRPNNIYGPGQHHEKLIPGTIDRLKKGEPVILHGDGSHQRCYLHVWDFIDALEFIWLRSSVFERRDGDKIFNVGTNNELTNLEVVNIIAAKLKIHQPIIHFVQDRCYNDRYYRLDSSIIKQLGWQPRVSFDAGIDSCL